MKKRIENIDMSRYTEQERKLILYCERNLSSQLKNELKVYADVKYNDMKFKLAAAAITLDSNDCLDIILKSLTPKIKEPSKHLKELVALAKSNNSYKCLLTLQNEYNVSVSYWFKFLISSNQAISSHINENRFKFECIQEQTAQMKNG